MPDYAAEIARVVRLSAPPSTEGLDVLVLAVSSPLVGRTMTLSQCFKILAGAFPHRRFYHADPCHCGLRGCSGLPFGVVGYVETGSGEEDPWRGINRILLRFDPVGEEVPVVAS